MTGHGCPRTSRSAWLYACWRSAGLALLLLAALDAHALAAGQTMRLRAAWGGGDARQWQGVISLSEGVISDLAPLGIEADEPGSMWLAEGRVEIRQRGRRGYDGLDLTVAAPADARLIVSLTAADNGAPAATIEIPLATLVASHQNSALDERNNRFVLRRAPGDMLRVTLPGDSLVFSAGETLTIDVEPHLLGVAPRGRFRLSSALVKARTDESLAAQEQEVVVPDEGTPITPIPVEFKLPDVEGVYDIVFTASRRGLTTRLGWKQAIAERRVQLVVLESGRRASPTTAPGGRLPPVVEEIDPTGSSWWEKFAAVPLIPGMRKGPLGSGAARVVSRPLGAFIELPAVKPEDGGAWEAYPLPIKQPGVAHILEVEYPTDAAQSLGVSIVEPNAAGAVMPIGLDSGVYVDAVSDGSQPGVEHHRLIFWPRTKAPLVLVSNLRHDAPALFGKLRVRRFDGGLPPLAGGYDGATGRMAAAYYDRPLFPENFSASEQLDPVSGQSLDDWVTFHQGAGRLIEYLQHTGQNGLMLSVYADGSTIYPSSVLEPTPRFDTGVFFSTGQDPVRKDVLEMLFRMFDRAGLRLAPAVQFAAPLPRLEAMKRAGGAGLPGLELVRSDGRRVLETHAPQRGLAPYYNPLDARVEEAMTDVVREIAERYGHHASFAGLAVQLSADGYAILPSADAAYDEATIAAFAREENVTASHARTAFSGASEPPLTPENEPRWLAWRARRLAAFHRELQNVVRASRPDAKLYLAGAGMLDGPEIQQQLRPRLPAAETVEEAMMQVGVDARQYLRPEDPVLLRPSRHGPRGELSQRAIDLQLNVAEGVEQRIQQAASPGALLFHQPTEMRLATFDAQSPFQPTHAWVVAQLSPSGAAARRRFVHALASLDALAMFDGGWLLSLGQEEACAGVWEAYRRLPAARFDTIETAPQPVVIRTLAREGRTYVYLVNDSPWNVTVNVQVLGSPAAVFESFRSDRTASQPQRRGEQASWTIELEPHDLVAGRFAAADVRLANPRVDLGQDVAALLDARIRALSDRAASLRSAKTIVALGNSDFEAAPRQLADIPGWEAGGYGTPDIRLDAAEKHDGAQSVHFSTNGTVGWLVSEYFETPRTGRLAVSAWLRVADPTRQPPLRLAIEELVDGESYYRHAEVGLRGADKLTREWSRYVFQIDNLSLKEGTQARVRFDMMGPGEVWIDEVGVFEPPFSDLEIVVLAKMIHAAKSKLAAGEFRDCHQMLDGYWPQFLMQRVPVAPELAQQRLGSRPIRPTVEEPKPAESPGLLQRFNRYLPGFLR